MAQIELLYFDSCPHWEQTADLIRAIVAEGGLAKSVDVELTAVADDEEAHRRRFLGSPTVRVNGKDVDPSIDGTEPFGLQCRLYRDGNRFVGAPLAIWIRAALGLEPTTGDATSRSSSSPCGDGSCR
jgi:hypothetical protein